MKFISIISFIGLLWGLELSPSSKIVHVFGDSHAYYNFRSTQVWTDRVSQLNHLGRNITFNTNQYISRTMHRVGRDALIGGLDIAEHNVCNGDIAIFCFGEVDCRWHIGRQVTEGKRSLDEVIQTLINNYIKTIFMNKNKYQQLNCAVLSVTPPCDRAFTPSFPWYGTLAERTEITRQLNAYLQVACQQAGLLFINTYHLYAGSDGSLKAELSDGSVHVGYPANLALKKLVVERLIEAGWL